MPIIVGIVIVIGVGGDGVRMVGRVVGRVVECLVELAAACPGAVLVAACLPESEWGRVAVREAQCKRIANRNRQTGRKSSTVKFQYSIRQN